MNSFFKKKENRRWTWLSPDQKTKNEIDFIMINHHELMTNIDVLSKFKFPSDHRLVRATLLLSRPVKSRKTFTTPTNIPKTEAEIKNYIETDLLHTKNKTKDMKEELSRMYKESNRSIRKDYNKHRYEIISRNIKNFRSAKKPLKS